MLIGLSALGRQKSDKNFKDLNSKFDFGLLKEGRFLGPRISRTLYFLDLEYLFQKNVFYEICKFYIEKSMSVSSRRVAFWTVLSAAP